MLAHLYCPLRRRQDSATANAPPHPEGKDQHGLSRLSEVLPRTPQLDAASYRRLRNYLRTFAQHYAIGFVAGANGRPGGLDQCTGPLGSTIVTRLEILAHSLPTPALREKAAWAWAEAAAGKLDVLPVQTVLTTFEPANMVLDPETWDARGPADFPYEAEMLPIGITVHIVNHTLGYVQYATPNAPQPHYIHYAQAKELHTLFRNTLISRIAAFKEPLVYAAFGLSATIGIFLWHGFTLDDNGAERVVLGSDLDHLALLEGLLDVPLPDRH
ncbi:hypothetical protein LTR86_005149 [Recurvomyces mirabilis]|nr:hypothetical protein LTR86_005149 [Recurvomyces mirabilis]